MMGLLIGEQYTAAYEPNADLAKLLSDGNSLRTYLVYGEMNMAYVAVNAALAQEWIPVTVRIPADGEYTFALSTAGNVDRLEGVYLIDYANENRITNLIESNYSFTSGNGSISGRFAINAKQGERLTPTGIDIVGSETDREQPLKFIYHDKMYILHHGVIYDATGKIVRTIQ